MGVENKLDKIIDILYDKDLLHWKEVPATDIIAFGKQKFNITWTDAEINFIMTILENDGYVVLNKKDISLMQIPTYSLTTKGVQLKRKGGFRWVKFIENVKQGIILWGAIFALIISFTTLYDFYEKHFKEDEKSEKCFCFKKQMKKL